MPEGPEIRLAADAVAAVIEGKKTSCVFFAFDHLKPYEEMLTGRTVTAVDTRGKAMLIHFDAADEGEPLTIYSHNQLYGKWLIAADGALPETNRQLRLAIHAGNGAALLYSASEIEVLHAGDWEIHPFLSKLGPDALDDTVTPEEIAARLASDRFRRKRLTTLLLDQGFLAGLGNYLRSEILFDAGVHPSLRPMDCTDEQIDGLARAALALTRRSYATRGITNDPDRAAALKDAGWKRRDYRFYVFNRDGQGCFRCGTTIVKEEMGGRRLYYCPRCQALAADAPAA